MVDELITLVWDVDDVLNPLMRSWFEKSWLRRHHGCDLAYGGISANPPHKLLGVTKREYLASLDQFRLSDEYRKMKPVADVYSWFRRHGKNFRHIALTATPSETAAVSAGWVLEHFGMWIRSYNFVPSKREGVQIPRYDRTKREYLSWLGKGDVLIDDSLANLKEAKSIGMQTVLISQPWNGGRQTISESLESLTLMFRS